MPPMPQLLSLLKQLRLSGILDSLEMRNQQAVEKKLITLLKRRRKESAKCRGTGLNQEERTKQESLHKWLL